MFLWYCEALYNTSLMASTVALTRIIFRIIVVVNIANIHYYFVNILICQFVNFPLFVPESLIFFCANSSWTHAVWWRNQHFLEYAYVIHNSQFSWKLKHSRKEVERNQAAFILKLLHIWWLTWMIHFKILKLKLLISFRIWNYMQIIFFKSLN